ncbi:MAG: hypothetical protein KatS3mg102_0062 [Planctomycetota bacterium]|nr:MAG: hypothetical protein KatS3mg102_0062 [Planctomycetota bacterium]
MLAYEAGLWLGEQAGLEPAERVALGIGLLERIVHQQGTWYSARDTLDEPWAEEALFVRRYGLQGLPSFGELQRLVGDPEDYLPEHFERLKERVLRVPGLAEAAERMPARVGEPLAVPPGLRLANRSWLALEDLANVLARLGIEGEIQSFGPRGLEQNQPGNVALVVRQGERSFVLGLGIDSTGVVTAAARHELHMDHKIEEAVVRILDGLAAAGGLEPAAGRAAYEEARAAGRDIRGALDLALPGLAARLPAGVRPQLGELLSLHNHGLIDPVLLGAVEAAFRRHFPRQ